MNGMAWFFLLALLVTNMLWFIGYQDLLHYARRAAMMSGRHPSDTGGRVKEGQGGTDEQQ